MSLIPGKDYQIALIRKAQRRAKKGRVKQILSMPTGSGKTWVALAWIDAINDAGRAVWVVPNSLIPNTEAGIRALDPARPVYVLHTPSNRRKAHGVYGADSIPQNGVLLVGWDSLVKLEAEIAWWLGAPNAAAEHYEEHRHGLRAEAPKWARDLPVYERPDPVEPAVVVFDEAHYGKDPKRTTARREQAQPWAKPRRVSRGGGRSAGVYRYALATRAAVAARLAAGAAAALPMTASTITEHRSDIYGVLRLLFSAREVKRLLSLPGSGYEADFRVKYCGAYQGEYGLVDGEPTNDDELQRALRSVVLQPDLEALRAHFLPVEAEAVKVPYTSWEPDALAPWERRAKGRMKRASVLRIRSTWEALLRDRKRYGSRPWLVFTEYRATARILGAVLNAPVITGATPDDEREAIKADHRRVGGPLVATVYALGHGHNLQYVDAIVCAEIPIRLDLFLQAVGRGQRLLRETPLRLAILVVDHTQDSETLATWSAKVTQTRQLTTHDTRHAEALTESGLSVDWAAVFGAMAEATAGPA